MYKLNQETSNKSNNSRLQSDDRSRIRLSQLRRNTCKFNSADNSDRSMVWYYIFSEHDRLQEI